MIDRIHWTDGLLLARTAACNRDDPLPTSTHTTSSSSWSPEIEVYTRMLFCSHPVVMAMDMQHSHWVNILWHVQKMRVAWGSLQGAVWSQASA